MNEEEIVRRACDGDQDAWEQLYRYLDGPIRFVLRRWRISPTDQDDLVQLTWLRLMQSLPAWQPTGSLKGFAMQATRWVLLDWKRKRDRRIVERPLEDPVGEKIQRSAGTAHPAIALVTLQECIDQTKPICQQVLNLMLAELGAEEIADILKISVNAARVRQARCKKCLVDCMKKSASQDKQVLRQGGGA